MDAVAFVDKWRKSVRSERSAAQEHFLDLCELLHHPKPGAVDPRGLTFTTERMVRKEGGKRGYADAWKKGYFGWEYKKKGGDLAAAYNQLLQYSGDLGNPPLLVVSDMDRIEVRTRFTGYPETAHVITLDTFTWPAHLETLRCVFYEPEKLRPEKTVATITEEAARKLAELAPQLRRRYADATRVAHFLDRLIFCMFAEDVGLLPNHVFSAFLKKTNRDPRYVNRDIAQLFEAMARGGDFHGETVPHFNGNLFDDTPPLELTGTELPILVEASTFDWGQMDPSIFGTLFERVMDPAQRSQLGAHYTGYRDIATLVEPVVMAPLRREWDEVREKAARMAPDVIVPRKGESLFPAAEETRMRQAQALVDAFLKRLRSVRVLDPACGSGNFLYVALRMLKDLEREVLIECRHRGLAEFELEVGPRQLHGIEINPYAFDLAQMTVWIGFIQWRRENGFPIEHEPILQALENFELKDAILDLSDPANPAEPRWPDAEFIVGNPPFLGYSKLRSELGHPYVESLFRYYSGRVSNQSDLCCYWFEKARKAIEDGRCGRAGLLATQSIRGGKNREVLLAIKRTGDLFFAISDRSWVLDGANVHISLVGFDAGLESVKVLDGVRVNSINANLSSNTDITAACRLPENRGIGFVGGFKFGSFDMDDVTARNLLVRPCLSARPTSQVVRPWINGLDVLRRRSPWWIIDFAEMPIEQASLFDGPFKFVADRVRPEREQMRRERRRERWWIHGEVGVNLRNAVASLDRFIVTPRVSKHRVFVWVRPEILIDGQLIAFARSDDFLFGVLHSRIHECWGLKLGTRLETRPRYTPTTCFETFPLPEPTPGQRTAVEEAARRLDELRSHWLNPPEWVREEVLEFPGSVDGPWSRFVRDPDARGIGTVRYPRSVPKDAHVFDLAKRTLTNLYNERPTWLKLAHEALDAAVFAAYGWDPAMTDEQILSSLLELNLERSRSSGPVPPVAEDGAEGGDD